MRALLQRVSEASVRVDNEIVGAIDVGLLVFLGLFPGDTEADLEWMADRILGLRIFADDEKPMNRSVVDVGGGLLVVSQFTLAADLSRGKRPGFSSAAPPEIAQPLYERFLEILSARHSPVAAGIFGADMQVALINDGPVTFLLERASGTPAPK